MSGWFGELSGRIRVVGTTKEIDNLNSLRQRQLI